MNQVTLIEAETFCIAGPSGQIRSGGEQGLYIRDTRVLSTLLLRLDGQEPLPLTGAASSPSAARFSAWWRAAEDRDPDPRLTVERRRVVSGSLWEEIRLVNHGVEPVHVEVSLEAAADFAYIFDVKHGHASPSQPGDVHAEGLAFESPLTSQRCELRAVPSADLTDGRLGLLTWRVELPARGDWQVELCVGYRDRGQAFVWPTRAWPKAVEAPRDARPLAETRQWHTPLLRCSDQRVPELFAQAAADLESLVIQDPAAPEDRFLAAGSPWYLTLFGRDSLLSAFMALPLDVSLAGETLRVLARRQGRVNNPATEEEPGKILHEVRHGGLYERSDLPPVYYGTMDATPLFVVLLHEAWRWGLPVNEVEALLPAAEAALAWQRDWADDDGDGFLEYQRSTERSLANQGWKDSFDGIQFADGRLAEAPISLCEVQGYAYNAAMRGAELLEAFGRPGGQDWRDWATEMRERFRNTFWIHDAGGDYPALALDGHKQLVDVVASNMGHLLSSGLLDADECALVAQRLGGPDMDSGWGLRTMTAYSPRFNPLSYHGGSVWPHDTAIAVHGLALTGHVDQATSLLRGLISAAPSFGYRLPELFGGEQRSRGSVPLPYPAACSPQAWAAGSAVLILRAAVGIHPDVPEGRLIIRPLWPFPWRELAIDELPLGEGFLSLTITREHGVHVRQTPPNLEVVVEQAPQTDVSSTTIGPLHELSFGDF